jgi:polysaccharide deacetylase family protein (PEP-CTERM system associated)
MSPWSAAHDAAPLHAMTCDVEDYFQVSAFNEHVSIAEWEHYECRIPRNVDLILERLEAAEAKATFFTLGWVAQHFPALVRRMADAGHEIASHGMRHVRVWHQSRQEFTEDAGAAKKLLEDTAGVPVVGYRAASWSIDSRTPWAHDVLAEVGYRYSSSVYPIRHDHFGVPDAHTEPYFVGDSGLLEIPPSVVRLLGRNVPAAGGGYFRLYPLRFSTWLIDRLQKQAQAPCVFYFHPWEMDPEQPRIDGIPAKAKFRHYLNLDKFDSRLIALLNQYRWGRMDEIYLGEASS